MRVGPCRDHDRRREVPEQEKLSFRWAQWGSNLKWSSRDSNLKWNPYCQAKCSDVAEAPDGVVEWLHPPKIRSRLATRQRVTTRFSILPPFSCCRGLGSKDLLYR